LAMAAFRNSERLLEDACILLRAGRYGPAHALATLALEEFGKHVICISAMARSVVEDDFWPRFWWRMRSHTSKLRQSRLLAETVLGDLMDADGFIRAWKQVERDHATKLRGLYVGWGSGGLEEPTAITQDEAATMIGLVSSILRRLGIFSEQALVEASPAIQGLSTWVKGLGSRERMAAFMVASAGLRTELGDEQEAGEADEATEVAPDAS
jgi:AbiV family abortive infection protein